VRMQYSRSPRSMRSEALLPARSPRRNLRRSSRTGFFEPFSHVRKDARAGTQSSLVLSVCDNQYIRDVQAQVEIARLLPSDRYPQTKFRHVPHEHPDWGDAGLDQAQGVCFIGRPLMFRNCRIIEQFPADLRFSIVSPPETGERADRSHVLPETGERTDFFCVTQNRPKAGPLRYNTVEQGANRHDYAIVQRFTIRFGGRDVVVLVIAGASGLARSVRRAGLPASTGPGKAEKDSLEKPVWKPWTGPRALRPCSRFQGSCTSPHDPGVPPPW